MSESEITDVYNKMLEDLVRLCRILLNYQMIHGVDAEDIVQEVLIRLMQSAGVFEDESHEISTDGSSTPASWSASHWRVAPASNAGGWVYHSHWNRKSSSRNNRTNSSNGCERAR